MRFLLIAGAGILLFLGTSTVPAQKTKEKEQKAATDTQIQELGGKTLEEWMKDIRSPDRSRGENAIRTVVGFGPDRAYAAVPILIAELKRRDVEVDVSIRVNAVMALGTILALGGAERPDPELVNDAVKVLTFFLLPSNESQSIVRYRSAEALGKIGPRSKPAIPRLLNLLHDTKTWETRQAAAIALGFIALDREGKKGPPAELVKGLYQALSDTSFQVRLAAIRSMTFIGTPANTSEKDRDIFLGYLRPKATSKKEDPTVRIWAHMAIMSISHEMTTADVLAICQMLKHREMAARVQAAEALAICGASAFADDTQVKERTALKVTISALMAALDDKEAIVALACIIALTKMGKEGKRAIPILREIARDTKRPQGLRQAAGEAAEFLNNTAVPAAPKETPKTKAIQK
jgi:HEAT repeat protein